MAIATLAAAAGVWLLLEDIETQDRSHTGSIAFDIYQCKYRLRFRQYSLAEQLPAELKERVFIDNGGRKELDRDQLDRLASDHRYYLWDREYREIHHELIQCVGGFNRLFARHRSWPRCRASVDLPAGPMGYLQIDSAVRPAPAGR